MGRRRGICKALTLRVTCFFLPAYNRKYPYRREASTRAIKALCIKFAVGCCTMYTVISAPAGGASHSKSLCYRHSCDTVNRNGTGTYRPH